MRTYTAEQYRRLVEETTDSRLQLFVERERTFLARIPGTSSTEPVPFSASISGSDHHFDVYPVVVDELVADDFHLVRLGLARQRVAA